MADASKRIKITKRHIYELKTPTNAVEIDKAVQWAAQDYKNEMGEFVKFDDSILVDVGDESVIIYWEQQIP